jgi:predicted metal-dependent RNase
VKGIAYRERLDLTPDLGIIFKRAGHILGSATVRSLGGSMLAAVSARR